MRRFLFALLAAVCAPGLHAEPREAPDSPARMEAVKRQIFLDRAHFRPGKIDGLKGEFTDRAEARYRQANNLPANTPLDLSSIGNPYREYTATEADLAWIGPQAEKPEQQEKLKAMLYPDLWALVAEKFHCDVDFLHELNPGLKDVKAGTVFRVPDAGEFSLADVENAKERYEQEKKAEKENAPEQPSPCRLTLSLKDRWIDVYENDKLVAGFPCTPGSEQVPVPVGTWKVKSNVPLPYFRWDKAMLESGVRSGTSYNLPPGPRNPVGIVWMGINKTGVGMHGTNAPDQIGRNESHGCIRLANWDAFLLSSMISPGVNLDVR